MHSYKLLGENIRQYSNQSEIIDNFLSDPRLTEIYNEINNSNAICVVPLVSTENKLNQIFDLHIIVRNYDNTSNAVFEYFLVNDFINSKTNLDKLFKELNKTTSVDLEQLVSGIIRQAKELTGLLNQEFHVVKDSAKQLFYFEKQMSKSTLN